MPTPQRISPPPYGYKAKLSYFYCMQIRATSVHIPRKKNSCFHIQQRHGTYFIAYFTPRKPYPPVTGSRKIGNFGGEKVKKTKANASANNKIFASHSPRPPSALYLNKWFSIKYSPPAARKKLSTLNQAGEGPIAPLYV